MTAASARKAARFAAAALAVDHIGPIDFDLTAGQCLALSGPSGAGKTRLLRAMADLDAHAGQCFLDGRAAADYDAPAWRSRVVYLSAESAWWADTPADHMAAEPSELTPELQALDLVPGLLDRPLARLSSGQRQRLALIRLLARRPRVLLLDEPTANLDTDNVARVETLIAGYCRQHGACAIWVGHDTNQLARIADQRITLDELGQQTASSICN